jgi:hypothetical protein
MLSSVVLASAEISPVDSLPNENSIISTTPQKTYKVDTTLLSQKEIDRLFWKPDPMRSVWLGAIVPGLGQIYNRSYWKLPIVYGGLMGCVYAITWTTNEYNGYKNAYRDIYFDIRDGKVSNDPSKSYIAILPEGYTIDRMGGVSAYRNRLKDWQNSSRRNRDLAIAATAIVYALTLIDAYVDAQLFDFDISNDLSLNVYPELYYDLQNQHSAEVKLAITF